VSIPLVDLDAQYRGLQEGMDAAIAAVVRQARFVGGSEIPRFEREFAAWCGVGHGIGVGNGTDALYLALRALGIGPGDEVVTVAHTFIATAEAIGLTGATPLFVDVLPDTLLMDPDALARAVTPATRAVVPVHLYGQMCDMDRIMDIARRHGLRVVEDAAQAHGARWRGRRAGTFGDAAAFSFFPGKNLGAYGDAGAVVTDDAALADRVRRLANHGRRDKYLHLEEGVNSRLDTLQAAVLSVKLPHLEGWNARRRSLAGRLMQALADLPGLALPVVRAEAEAVWHLFVVRVPERERVQQVLAARGIASGIHYPVPLHRQPAYAGRHADLRLPVTERAAGEILSLPLYPELTDGQVAAIVAAVREALAPVPPAPAADGAVPVMAAPVMAS